jgi:hypothetical protein
VYSLKMIFPPFEVATKIAIALGIGLLVGLERQWSQKDVGVRTFSITALLGCLSVLVSPQLAAICLGGVLLLVAFMNGRSLLVDRSLEMTTSVALIVTFILGVLAGQGHLFTPVASAIVMTMLLAWKTELQRFAGDLKPSEIRGAVLLGLIGFVIYPLLPNRFIDSWHLLNPRQSWLIVIIVAGLGFANYVLLRIYSNRGLYYTAVLGGLVNSTATAAELARTVSPKSEGSNTLVALVLLTSVAMFVRNLVILAIFAPVSVSIAAWPLLAMIAGALRLEGACARRGAGQESRPRLAGLIAACVESGRDLCADGDRWNDRRTLSWEVRVSRFESAWRHSEQRERDGSGRHHGDSWQAISRCGRSSHRIRIDRQRARESAARSKAGARQTPDPDPGRDLAPAGRRRPGCSGRSPALFLGRDQAIS